MKCPYCGYWTEPHLFIFRNGTKAITERCVFCKKAPNKDKPYLPFKNYPDWESLPLLQDNRKDWEVECAVTGCEEKGTEYHHFAPKSLFKNSEDWPGAFLCQKHHVEWHKITKTANEYHHNREMQNEKEQ